MSDSQKVFIGCDVSLNKSGFVAVDENGVVDFWYIRNCTTGKSLEEVEPSPNGFKRDGRSGKGMSVQDRFAYNIRMYNHLSAEFSQRFDVVMSCVEGCSFGSKSNNAITTAINAGVFRSQLIQYSPFIDVPPTQLKRFASGNGTADKGVMHHACVEYEGTNFERFGNVCEDLVDAYFLAIFAREYYLQLSGSHRKFINLKKTHYKGSNKKLNTIDDKWDRYEFLLNVRHDLVQEFIAKDNRAFVLN